jgi:hypothetical protein
MHEHSGPQNMLVFDYLTLRKAVGILGVALPFVLAIGKWITQGPGLQSSMSCYYYTDMRNYFVGSMCSIGMFLMSCKGYDKWDVISGRLACVLAVCVAFFPTKPATPTHFRCVIGDMHLAFAGTLFVTLAIMCLALFTKTTAENRPTRQKLQRNMVYRVCGIVILVCVALCPVVMTGTVKHWLAGFCPVFWLEATAVFSFGFAWLVKGETILKDKS